MGEVLWAGGRAGSLHPPTSYRLSINNNTAYLVSCVLTSRVPVTGRVVLLVVSTSSKHTTAQSSKGPAYLYPQA